MELTKKQGEAAAIMGDRTTTELLFGGAAGGSKSFFGCLWLIDRCTNYPNTRWLMGRSKLKSLKETTLNTFFDVAKMLGITKQYVYNAHMGTITFTNGSEIILKDLFLFPSDAEFDSLGSLEISGAFIDEANQVTLKAKNVVKSRIRYKLDEYGLTPKLLMTCNPAKNWTYTDFYKPYRDGTLPTHKKFLQVLIEDNPFITKHYKDNLLTLDENSKQRLLYGNWEYSNDPATLVKFDSIVDLWTNTQVIDDNAAKYITADIARLGNDKAVIMVWQGWTVIHITTVDKSKLNELSDIITALKIEYGIPNSRILADEAGMGGGIVDFMGIEGFLGSRKATDGENYKNLRSQCFYKLAEKINAAQIHIAVPDHRDEMIQELEQVKSYKVDSDTKLRILPKDLIKEAIGRSPDFSDTLSMRLWFALEGATGSVMMF